MKVKLTPVCLLLALFGLCDQGKVFGQGRDQLSAIQQAIRSTSVERQRAAFVLIYESSYQGELAGALSDEVERFLAQPRDEETTAMALAAYGRLGAPAATAAKVLKPHFASSSVPVRRAAGQALVGLLTTATRTFDRPIILVYGNSGAIASVATGPAAVVWSRAWLPTIKATSPVWRRMGEDAQNLLPLCALALKDADDRVKESGADGINLVARATSEVLPDPRTSNAETKLIDPYEAKLKWLLLKPVFEAVNANAPALVEALTVDDVQTRTAAARAAQASVHARALGLATRRFPPDDVAVLTEESIPEDALRKAAAALLPALARRLDDSSADIRLIAIESFEYQEAEAKPYLGAIVHASVDYDIFVRWVATRTLSRLYASANERQGQEITYALSRRVLDADIDVRTTALTALGRGALAAKAAGDSVLFIVESGDPDQRVLAIRTLGTIQADPAITLPVISRVLVDSPAVVRRAALAYVGSLGKAARPIASQVRPLLTDPNDDVRREAARVLLGIE